jgi:hypothetical protein
MRYDTLPRKDSNAAKRKLSQTERVENCRINTIRNTIPITKLKIDITRSLWVKLRIIGEPPHAFSQLKVDETALLKKNYDK